METTGKPYMQQLQSLSETLGRARVVVAVLSGLGFKGVVRISAFSV